MLLPHPYTIFPLGDSALTIDFGNIIDIEANRKVLRLFHHLKSLDIPGVIDIIPAYSSLTIYYDPVALFPDEEDRTAFDVIAELIETLTMEQAVDAFQPPRTLSVPVCYAPAFSTDMEEIGLRNGISREEIIRLHTGKTNRIYMIGFLPGFAYMGQVDPKLVIPRKTEPVQVVAGSVGIAGIQTGIYPFDSPGGWQIIGRTPLPLFQNNENEPVLFQPGDMINFYSITEDEFADYQSRRM